jgi:hypothetical protein
MILAPNETQEQYNRKIELMEMKRRLTDSEMQELRELAQNAISHLTIKGV